MDCERAGVPNLADEVGVFVGVFRGLAAVESVDVPAFLRHLANEPGAESVGVAEDLTGPEFLRFKQAYKLTGGLHGVPLLPCLDDPGRVPAADRQDVLVPAGGEVAECHHLAGLVRLRLILDRRGQLGRRQYHEVVVGGELGQVL